MSGPRPNRFRVAFSLRVFLTGCLITAATAAVAIEWLRLAAAQRVEDEDVNIEAKLTARVVSYDVMLRGIAGLFATDAWVSRSRFHRFVEQLGIEANYPGVQGVGVSRRLHPDEIPAFEKAARGEGWPDFHVWPPHPRPYFHAILYLEPEDARNRVAIGYDMHTEPVRREAMDRARDSGDAVATAKVTLVQEIEARKQPGFLIYFPFYAGGERPDSVEERQRRLAGFAYAAFRAGDFIRAVIEPARSHGIMLRVFDGPEIAPAALLFQSEEGPPPRDAAVRTRRVHIGARTWTLEYATPVHIGRWLLILVGGGLLVSAGIAFLVDRAEYARTQAEASEAEKRARENELAVLMDSVPVLVAYIDDQQIFRLCSRRYVEWYGLQPAALIGQSVASVVGPEVYRQLEPYLRRSLAGQVMTFERWYKPPGGGAHYLATTYAPARSDTGRVRGIFSLTSDLTSHKRAEEAALFVADCGKQLIASMDVEATARGLVHLAVPRVADVAVLFRAEGDHLRGVALAHVDAAVENRMGDFFAQLQLPLSAPHNIGLAARTGVVVVSADLSETDLDRAAGNDAEREMLHAVQLRSALHVPVVVRGHIWGVFSFGTTAASGRQFTDEHRPLGEEISTRVRLAVENALLYREAQQEIEERRRAERVTRETEESHRLLVEGVRDYAIMGLDVDGRIESWNEGAENTFGLQTEDAIGSPSRRLFTPEDQAAGVPEAQLEAARERGAVADERWFVRADGSRFWASNHIAALRTDQGEVRGYARIMRDLTQRKRMEEELERRVQARTLELNEAVQELEAFSYSVSHDLRAPLRTIRSFTELAIEEADGRLHAEERDYLDRVQRAAARLERLISDLLAYTRVSKTRVELRPVSLQALVSNLRHEHPEFQPPRADVGIEGTLLPVIGNEAYLTQCLTNLLGNAVKFVAPGRLPVVRLWTERTDGLVRLYVRDNGVGIAPEHQARAFEMFERLHMDGTYEGTGVGLAIVRRAVHRMRGSVGLQSAVGEGTTFWIELPAADET